MIIRLIVAAGVLAMAAPLAAHAAPQRAAAPAKARFTQLERISIQAVGKGPPLFLIPGLSSPREVWSAFVPELAKTRRVYLVQVNGFGGDAPRGNLSTGILDGMVGELHGFIVKNRLRGVAVAGHSMGGLVGMMLAKAHPGDVGRLMIVDALPFVGSAYMPGSTVESLRPQAASLRDQMVTSHGRPIEMEQDNPLLISMSATREGRTRVLDWMRRVDMRVAGQAMYEALSTDMRGDMAVIATPITLVYPWSDALPRHHADAFYRAEYAKAPNVTFIGVGGSRHFVTLDQPEAFRAALKTFLK